MSSTPEFNQEQLAAARKALWRQGGDGSEALLTLEAAKEWVGELGLLLFAPRAHQLGMPAPSLVEATLGEAKGAPSAAEMETARGLVARMVAEGAALPLNLLGGPGDLPDFVVSAQMFGYVFTLRGDKGWKQPPSTSDGAKVSPLALKVYEALVAGGAMSARELATELGRELTESAIARALTELWTQLRVIPLLQQDGAATTWELTSRRFTKLIKAGANAGQPTALSALISVYLAQVFAAVEEDAETFLSPLAARSRVRDVLHGLTGARQLESIVLEGKTLLYIPGALPEFPELTPAETVAKETASGDDAAPKRAPEGERIRTFAARRPAAGARRERPPYKPTDRKREFSDRKPRTQDRGGARPPRREFKAGDKPAFTRPWDEDRGARPARPASAAGDEGRPPRREFKSDSEGRPPRKPRTEFRSDSERPARGPRKDFRSEGGQRPPRKFGTGFSKDREQRAPSRGPRKEFGSSGGERPARGPRKDFRSEGGERPARAPRPSFRKDGEQRPSSGSRPSFRKEGERRPSSGPRPSFRQDSDRRPPRRESESGDRARGPRADKPFRPRPSREGEEQRRPFVRREGGEGRPAKPRGDFAGGPRADRGEHSERARPPRPEGESRGPRPARSFEKRGFSGKPKTGFGGKPKTGFGDKPRTGFGGKPKTGFGGKPKFGGRPKPGGGASRGARPGGATRPPSKTSRPKRETEE